MRLNNRQRYYDLYRKYLYDTRVICIGICGGMASGKSHICNMLKRNGYTVFNSDEVAKRIMYSHPLVLRELYKMAGPELIAPGGFLRKEVVKALLANDPEAARRINCMVHPLVAEIFCQIVMEKDDYISVKANRKSRFYGFHLPESYLKCKSTFTLDGFMERMRRISRKRVIFLESALLFESEFSNLTDCNIFVDASRETRVRRLMKRNKINRKQATSIIYSRGTLTQARRRADYYIVND